MEDSIGYELFLRRCLSEKEFKILLVSLDKLLSDKENLNKICNTWTIFYEDSTKESQETLEYLRDNFSQLFMTQRTYFDGHGPFLDIVEFGLRKRINGAEQIRQYTDKINYYVKYHSIFTRNKIT